MVNNYEKIQKVQRDILKLHKDLNKVFKNIQPENCKVRV